MYKLLFLAAFAGITLFFAWLVNGLVNLLSSEQRRDTGRLWRDMFFRVFAVFELGAIGRVLNFLGLEGVPRKIVLFTGLICVLLFLFRDCGRDHDTQHRPIQTHPVQTP
jgi:hypothetical protein